MSDLFRRMAAEIAREQDVVDLAASKSDARIAILQKAIDDLRTLLTSGADRFADEPQRFRQQGLEVLRALKGALLTEILQHPSDVRDREQRLVEHRARRGVRKVRGAK